jgi:hypothetical protein
MTFFEALGRLMKATASLRSRGLRPLLRLLVGSGETFLDRPAKTYRNRTRRCATSRADILTLHDLKQVYCAMVAETP